MGAGVVGVTTAYYLAKRGAEVVVIDRQFGPGLETSYANAGQLSYGMTSRWAAPVECPHRSDPPTGIVLSRLWTSPRLWSVLHATFRAGFSWAAKALGVKFPSAEWGRSSL